jgi:hypothetical protein
MAFDDLSIEQKLQANLLGFLTQGMTEEQVNGFLYRLKKEQDKMAHKPGTQNNKTNKNK